MLEVGSWRREVQQPVFVNDVGDGETLKVTGNYSRKQPSSDESAPAGRRRSTWAADPVQRGAQKHIHREVKNITERRNAFRAADPDVKIHVIAQLRALTVAKQGSNAGPATGALVAAFLTSATIFGAFFVASWNGFYSAIVKMMDAHTGKVAGISQTQFDNFTGSLTEILSLFVLVILVVALLVLSAARSNDSLRGSYSAWLVLFEEDMAAAEGSSGALRSVRERLLGWLRWKPSNIPRGRRR
jgi:hypothetical protein